jgi:hypothetical protein
MELRERYFGWIAETVGGLGGLGGVGGDFSWEEWLACRRGASDQEVATSPGRSTSKTVR